MTDSEDDTTELPAQTLELIDAGTDPLDVTLTFSQDAEGTTIEAATTSGVMLRLRMPADCDIREIDRLFERFPEYMDTVTGYLLHATNKNTNTN